MSSAKQYVEQLLQRLPDDCTIEDIQYQLYVLEKVHGGLAAVERGEGVGQEEAEKQLS